MEILILLFGLIASAIILVLIFGWICLPFILWSMEGKLKKILLELQRLNTAIAYQNELLRWQCEQKSPVSRG